MGENKKNNQINSEFLGGLLLRRAGIRTASNILLVRKHQQQAVRHFQVVEDAVQFRLGLLDPGMV